MYGNYPPGVTSADIDAWYGDEPDAYGENYDGPTEDDEPRFNFDTDPDNMRDLERARAAEENEEDPDE